MSNPSNSTNSSSIPSNVGSNTVHPMSSTSSDRTVKRSIEDPSAGETKQMKTEELPNEKPLPSANSQANNRPSFRSAATLVPRIMEITDEELLEFTLEFERKHGLRVIRLNFEA